MAMPVRSSHGCWTTGPSRASCRRITAGTSGRASVSRNGKMRGMIGHALRTIGRMRGLAAVVILSLGVGIGVNTAVFSWIQAIVLKPIPGVDNSGSFYHVEPKAEIGTYPGSSWTEYRDLIARLSSLEQLVAFRMAPLNVGESGRTERTYAQLVSGNFFDALRLAPAAGRFIRPDEAERPG